MSIFVIISRHLWDSHFRDSTNALIEIFKIIKSERINGENFNNDTEFLVTAIGALINRLNEYGDFFDTLNQPNCFLIARVSFSYYFGNFYKNFSLSTVHVFEN